MHKSVWIPAFPGALFAQRIDSLSGLLDRASYPADDRSLPGGQVVFRKAWALCLGGIWPQEVNRRPRLHNHGHAITGESRSRRPTFGRAARWRRLLSRTQRLSCSGSSYFFAFLKGERWRPIGARPFAGASASLCGGPAAPMVARIATAVRWVSAARTPIFSRRRFLPTRPSCGNIPRRRIRLSSSHLRRVERPSAPTTPLPSDWSSSARPWTCCPTFTWRF